MPGQKTTRLRRLLTATGAPIRSSRDVSHTLKRITPTRMRMEFPMKSKTTIALTMMRASELTYPGVSRGFMEGK